jgi:AraC-like DNA-binding protein
VGFDKYRDKLTSTVRFNQPHLISSFDKKYLGLKMVNADPIASQIAINQCETELSALGERRRLAMRVRDILTNSEQHYLSIESVAELLHMSDRTLKRQLAAEGTSFSTLVDEVRYRHATSLLSRTDYSLEQIADELGYSDVAILAVHLSAGVDAVRVTGVKTLICNIAKCFIYKHFCFN